MTEKPKFTPGPWTLTEPVPGDKDIFIDADGDGWERLCCTVTRDDCDTETALANARLIAAAPELYEACAVILAKHESGSIVLCSRELELLRAALAKAENHDSPAAGAQRLYT